MNNEGSAIGGVIVFIILGWFVVHFYQGQMEAKYQEGLGDGEDKASSYVNYQSVSYPAGYDEGYNACLNGKRKAY